MGDAEDARQSRGLLGEGLAALKPSFEMMGQMGFDATALRKYSQVERIEHVHTPGNSSGIVDGAALVMIGSAAAGKLQGLTPRARIVATAVERFGGVDMLVNSAGVALLDKALDVVDRHVLIDGLGLSPRLVAGCRAAWLTLRDRRTKRGSRR